MNKKVAILMSTYNGERYLAEQIQSIIDQSYPNWTLYIRDDGSTDRTQEIIKKYANQNSRIVFFNEGRVENVGVVRSFMELLEKTSADCYMFSDQDDVWLADKVKDTLAKLEQNEPGPVCVFTDLEIVDQDLKPIRRMNGDNIWTDFRLLLFSNCVTGCTMMINEALKQLIHFKTLDYRYVYMHDWWIGLLAAAFGKLVYLNQPTIQYRQHGDNVVGSSKKNTLGHVLYRLTHLKPERKRAREAINIIYEFNREYPGQLQGVDQRYVQEYARLKQRSSVGYNIRLCLRLAPPRLTTKQKFFFSYLMIMFPRDFVD